MNKWPYSPNFVFQKIDSFSLFQAFNVKNYLIRFSCYVLFFFSFFVLNAVKLLKVSGSTVLENFT